MSETPQQETEELRSPHLTHDEDDRLNALEASGKSYHEAWRILLSEMTSERRTEVEAANNTTENQSDDVISNAVSATQRVIEEPHPLDVQPEPPKSGETDEDIRHRHKKRLLDVQVTPPTADEQVRANEAKAFADKILQETGGLDVHALLETHPELTDDAKRLGFIE